MNSQQIIHKSISLEVIDNDNRVSFRSHVHAIKMISSVQLHFVYDNLKIIYQCDDETPTHKLRQATAEND
jgi:hypothetical protein